MADPVYDNSEGTLPATMIGSGVLVVRGGP